MVMAFSLTDSAVISAHEEPKTISPSGNSVLISE